MSVQSGSVRPQTLRTRRLGVCAECQRQQLVRKDGLIARHRSVWPPQAGEPCVGAETTPIPLNVPTWADYPDNAGKVLERWDYLSLPLRTLLLMLHAEVREIAAPRVGWCGEIRRSGGGSWWQWVVFMPIGGEPVEHDLVVRGLLAAAHGVDVADWPVELVLRAA